MLCSKRRIFAMFIVPVCSASMALAQTGTSRVSGRVVDSKAAIVAGAAVTVTNEATRVSQTQTTTDAGVYAFASLPVGIYTITVERAGFKKFQRTGNALEVNTPLTVDVTMEVGGLSEVVTVQGGTEQLQTSNATIGNVVEQKAIETLPLNGRNPLTLLVLEPGVVQRSAGAAGSGVHVNGSRDRAFNVTIDGIEANESSVPNPVSNLYRLNPDNVQEYKVTTNNATPEEGRNSGASVSVATRSGTNDFHGTAFYFLRNDALNSNDFFSNAQGTPKPVIKLNQFGIEIGGPIKKNKTFFFGSYQGNRISSSQPIDQTFGPTVIYTAQARQGIFRYFKADPNVPFVLNGITITRNTPLLVDSLTGNLAPGVRNCTGSTDTNCIFSYNILASGGPTNTALDPVASKILNSFPLPNNFGAFSNGTTNVTDGLNFGSFLWNPPTSFKGPAIMARVDHNFSENSSIFGRYLYSKYNTLEGDPLNGRPQVFPGFPPQGEVFRTTSNLALSYRRVFSPRVINELTMGYARFIFLFTQGEANPAFPDVPPYDFRGITEPYNNTPRTFRAVTTPQILDNLSIVKGAHLLRTGLNFRFYRHVDQRGQPGGINVTPSITFNSADRSVAFGSTPGPRTFITPSGLNSTDRTRLLNSINNLLGFPAIFTQTFISNLSQNIFLPFKVGDQVSLFDEKHIVDQYNFYFQDEWKFRPNLTLNYGVRWEFNPAPSTSGGNVFVPNTPIAGTPGPTNPVPNDPGAVTFVKSDRWFGRNNVAALAPRIGLAYSPNWKTGLLHTVFGDSGKSVIRLGYGIAFDPISSFQVTAVAGRVPGLVTSCAITVGSAPPKGCDNAVLPDVKLGQGFPVELALPTAKPSSFLTPPLLLKNQAPPITVFAPDLKLPTVHEWSLSVQRELPGGFIAQVAYIGRRGMRLFMAYNINQINADSLVPSFLLMRQNVRNGCLPSGSGPVDATVKPCTSPIPASQIPLLTANVPLITNSFVNSSTVIDQLNTNAAGAFAERIENTTLALKLRPNQQFDTITYLDNSGSSNYHAAQFTLRRRFASGLGLSVAYTFGKSIDNQSVDPVGAASGGGLSTSNSRTPIDDRDWRLERGRSDFDRTHVLTIASVWELPVGKGKHFLNTNNGFVNQLLGGWTINGIYNYMSGEPFSVRSGSRTANSAHESRAVVLAPVKARLQEIPNVLGPVVFPDNTAFALPEPGQNGAGRNIFTAPGYWNLDLGIVKLFQINERFRLQFRTEMFNALNHPNFDNPRDASVGSPSFLSEVFGRTCCATVAPPSTQTIIQTGESARVIQFALKLQF